MRHQRGQRKLGRTSSHRRALLRNLVSSLFVSPSGRITTTVEKAKEARPIAEKMITLGKREGIHARRLAARYISERSTVRKLFEDIAPKFADRKGGYTRILRLEPRPGDNADVALLELVGIAEAARKAAKAKASDKKDDKGKGKDKDAVAKDEAEKAAAKVKAREESQARREERKRDREAAKAGRGASRGKAKPAKQKSQRGG
jgi:large subunit ribosomal protein L17